MRRMFIVLVAVGAMVAAAASQATALRHTAVPNGRILLQANVHGYTQLFTIEPDGTGLRQITHLKLQGDVQGAEQAAWSPDGSTIAFDSGYGHTPQHEISIFTIKPDGSSLRQLPLAVGAFNGAPAYSPDGTMISFDQDAGPSAPTVHGIYVAQADGSAPRRVTTGIATDNATDTKSHWSPDGQMLVFTRVDDSGRTANFKVRLDGTELKQLTPWSMNAENAFWSPDGSKILFNSNSSDGPRPGKDANLFTMKPDGSGIVALTHFTGGDVQAYVDGWSPDGKWIVFHKTSSTVDQLFVMDARGGHIRPLTHLPRSAQVKGGPWGTAH